MAKTKDYFGLNDVISLILAIIPVTSLVCGIVTRLKEKKILAVIVRVLLGWNIVWIADLIMMIMNKHIFRLLNY